MENEWCSYNISIFYNNTSMWKIKHLIIIFYARYNIIPLNYIVLFNKILYNIYVKTVFQIQN